MLKRVDYGVRELVGGGLGVNPSSVSPTELRDLCGLEQITGPPLQTSGKCSI